MRTLGSLTLCRSLLEAGLVDRFRVALELVAHRTFDDRLRLLEYVPTVLAGPPGAGDQPG